MKTRLLLFLACSFTFTTFAQDSTFQLKDYKYRTPGYRSLSLNFGLDGNSHSRETPSTQGKETQKNFNLYLSTFNFYKTTSTDKRISSASYYLLPGFSTTKSTRENYENKSTSFQTSFYSYHNNRFYKPRNWFLELNNQLGFSSMSLRSSDTTGTSKTNNMQANDLISIGYGKGRIERVQDAQMALFIINDLEEMGLLERIPDAQTINELAVLVTEINNKRIFDNRRRRIYELTQIESFLRNKGLSSTTDIRHFAIINDNWAFANNPIRYSGSAWFIRMQGSGEIWSSTYESQVSTINYSNYKNYRLGIGPQVGFESYHPINLQWQTNFNTNLGWKYFGNKQHSKWEQTGNSFESETKANESELNYFISYGLAYYPNTRTIINGSVNVEASKYWFDTNHFLKHEYGIKSTATISADYFLGYRTRLNAGFHINYDKWYNVNRQDAKFNYHNLYASFSASLFHNIF